MHVVHQTPKGAPVFTPDSKLAEEFDELKPKDGGKVIGKNHPSAFADTDLQEFLGDESGAKVVLTGYMVSPRDSHAECCFGWLTANRRHTSAYPLLQGTLQDWATT